MSMESARVLRLTACAAAMFAMANCAAYPNLQAPAPPFAGSRVDGSPPPPPRDNIEVLQRRGESTVDAAPTPQSFATPEQIAALLEPRRVQVSLPPQPLPQFIDTVFGEILRVPYSTGPGVAERRDIISLRGPDEMDNVRLFTMAQMALAQYGLGVALDEGGVRIVQDTVLSGRAPTFIMARSSPDTPQSSRPVMQFFSVASVDVEALLPLLEQSYPNRGSVRFSAQADTNTLLISGSARDVAAAAVIVRQLDQAHFANGQIARIEPVFMSTEQLADTIVRALSGEGYRVNAHTEAVRGGVINVVPLEHANQVLVFANDERIFERALFWARRVDRAEAMGDTPGLYIYHAVHVSAEELGALISQSGSGEGAAPTLNPPEVAVRRNNGVRVGPEAGAGEGALSFGGVTIDTAGNRILFRGTAAEFARLRSTLVQLDAPQPQVLIELTIAEVTLTDETRFGVEWFLEQTVGGDLIASTLGGSVRQPGGLGMTASHAFSRGTVEAALNAFASNRNLNILSTPRVFTRSGRTAEILIGTDVPIITTQRASDNQTGGDTDVLQTVQYRQTGIILNVRPIVLGEDRIDITLYQEVSTQQPNTGAAIASPLILNRSVATQISLQEGMTAVIGGLIQDNYSREQRGVPGLKDIPLLGAVFRSEEVTGDKVELVILVTPYIVRGDADIANLTEAMTSEVNRTLRRRGTQVYTLYPWRVPLSAPRNHGLRANDRSSASAPIVAEEPAGVPVTTPPAAPLETGPTVLRPEPR